MRRRSSTRSSSGTANRNERIKPLSAAVAVTSCSPVARRICPAIGDHIPPLPSHWHLSVDRFPHWSWDTGKHQSPDGGDDRCRQGTMNAGFRQGVEGTKGEDMNTPTTKRIRGRWAAIQAAAVLIALAVAAMGATVADASTSNPVVAVSGGPLPGGGA